MVILADTSRAGCSQNYSSHLTREIVMVILADTSRAGCSQNYSSCLTNTVTRNKMQISTMFVLFFECLKYIIVVFVVTIIACTSFWIEVKRLKLNKR